MINTPWVYLYVAIGGALGSCLRYFFIHVVFAIFGKGFPLGTLFVNVVGSFIIGLLFSLIDQGSIELIPWKTFIGFGFLGAFTTFSTFSIDTLLLMQQGSWFKAGLNILLNVCVCLLAAWLGSRFAIFFKS